MEVRVDFIADIIVVILLFIISMYVFLWILAGAFALYNIALNIISEEQLSLAKGTAFLLALVTAGTYLYKRRFA